MGESQLTRDKLIKEMRIIMEHPEIREDTKRYYLTNVAIQQWTEHLRDGEKAKFLGCVYWSKEALYKYKENLEIIKKLKMTNKKSKIPKSEQGLNHEHVIPKNWLISEIFLKNKKNQLPEVEEDYIKKYLEDFTFACVVTRGEHSRINNPSDKENYTSTMPPNAFKNGTHHPDYHKYWLRYKIAGVEVYNLDWSPDYKKAKVLGQINTDMTDWEEPLIPVISNISHNGKVIYDLSQNSIIFK